MNQMNLNIIEKIDNDLHLTASLEPEVKAKWFVLGIQLRYIPVFTPARTFVWEQGRIKYVVPIYVALCENGYRQTAYDWYSEKIDFYSPITRAAIKRSMTLILTEEEELALQKHEAQKAFLKA